MHGRSITHGIIDRGMQGKIAWLVIHGNQVSCGYGRCAVAWCTGINPVSASWIS